MVKQKILIFSLGPVFKNYVHGGSQKILREVATYLGRLGHEVNIYCNWREDNMDIFNLSENVTVFPRLYFKQTYPSAYKTNPFNLWKTIEVLEKQINKHDKFYIHDGQINFPFLHNKKIPTIVSLRDFVYPETLIGGFNFRRDEMIVNSTITFENIKYTIGNFLPDIHKRIHVIPNGFDFGRLKRVNTSKFKEDFNIKIDKDDKVILFPNRPEPSKGIFDNLEVLDRLVNKNKINIKFLIPKYIDLNVSSELKELYREIDNFIRKKHLCENIIYHDWVPYDRIPEYLSLGDLTLSIGNFIEAFGSNSSIESLACGTPVILSKVGAQRKTISDELVPKVDYGDIDEIERIAVNLLTNKKQNFNYEKIRKYLEENFNFKDMVDKYANIILNCNIKPNLEETIEEEKNISGDYMIAPWCCITKFGIYCDYDYKHIKISKEIMNRLKNNSVIKYDNQYKNCEEIENLISYGYIVKIENGK